MATERAAATEKTDGYRMISTTADLAFLAPLLVSLLYFSIFLSFFFLHISDSPFYKNASPISICFDKENTRTSREL